MAEYDTESPQLFIGGNEFVIWDHYGPRHNEIMILLAMKRLQFKPPKKETK